MILNTKTKKLVDCIAEFLMILVVVALVSSAGYTSTIFIACWWFLRDQSVPEFMQIIFNGGITTLVIMITLIHLTTGIREKARCKLAERF